MGNYPRLSFKRFVELEGDLCAIELVNKDKNMDLGWVGCPEDCCERPDHSHATGRMIDVSGEFSLDFAHVSENNYEHD